MGLRDFLRVTPALIGWLVSFLFWGGAIVNAAEIKVVSGSAVAPVMIELIARFEKSSGHRVSFDSDGAIGAITARLLNGEAADVAIVSGAQIDQLERQGKVVAASRTDIAKVGVGVFVRQGASKPEIDSADAFRRAMLSAKSIGYNDPAAGAPVSIYLIGLFERMDIAAVMQAKTTMFKQRTERFEAVARGDVEIGFNQISEIIATPSVDLVGPLPAPLQNYTQFSSGIVANGKEQDTGRAFVRFITAPASNAIWRAKGFEVP